MRQFLRGATLAVLGVALPIAARGQGARPAPQTFRGLEISVDSAERASSAPLRDCPPGANTPRAVARPDEEFVIVSVHIKVLPGYTPGPIKRPVLTDGTGKDYNTSASFVDVEKVPEFSCGFPFRVPRGTKLKSLRIETVSLDLTGVGA